MHHTSMKLHSYKEGSVLVIFEIQVLALALADRDLTVHFTETKMIQELAQRRFNLSRVHRAAPTQQKLLRGPEPAIAETLSNSWD